MISLKLAIREMINDKRFSLLFMLNLAIGLFGFISLDGFKRSFQELLTERSKLMLSADLSVSARRDFSETELQKMRAVLGNQSVLQNSRSLYSMMSLVGGQASKLVEIKAIERVYPFYGHLILKNQGRVEGDDLKKDLFEEKSVWLAPELLQALGVRVGDKVMLGELQLTVSDTIVDDSSMSWASTSFSPRVYMSMKDLEASGLIQKGSTMWRRIYIKVDDDVNVDLLENDLTIALNDPSLRVRSHLKSGNDNGRLISYLTDYLGLVSLVAFFLSGLGAIYLFRGYLLKRHKEIATLLSLGMTHAQAVLTYVVQVVSLGILSALMASLLAWITLPLTANLLSKVSSIEFSPVFSFETLLLAMSLGALGTLLLCLPLLSHIREVSPSALFQEAYNARLNNGVKQWALALPALVCFYLLAIIQSNSLKVGSLFFVILAVAVALLVNLGIASLNLLKRAPKSSLSARLAIRYLHRQKTHAISCFLALSLGTLLINLIPQIRNSILSELEQPSGVELPSLFLFDIQQDQKDALQSFMKSQNSNITSLSPMIPARLISIKGEKIDADTEQEAFSREEQVNQRTRNRGVNLSYIDTDRVTGLVEGRDFSGAYEWGEQPAEVSLEERYAQRLGVDLGDKLNFEVQGLTIDAVVSSIRKVKWNSFQPNFFIQFQRGVLEDAPQSYLASLASMDEASKVSIQNLVAKQFPNVSVIDVDGLVAKLSEFISQMSIILEWMAWITIAAGMVVIFSIAIHQAQSRKWDTNLLKVLGARFSEIQISLLKEFFLLASLASIFGGILGVVASYVISSVIFEGVWKPDLSTPVICFFLVVGVCLLITWAASYRTLQKPVSWMD